eukprot:scaffold101522_cov52-Phaeocystis_antarctica.AAC.2
MSRDFARMQSTNNLEIDRSRLVTVIDRHRLKASGRERGARGERGAAEKWSGHPSTTPLPLS